MYIKHMKKNVTWTNLMYVSYVIIYCIHFLNDERERTEFDYHKFQVSSRISLIYGKHYNWDDHAFYVCGLVDYLYSHLCKQIILMVVSPS